MVVRNVGIVASQGIECNLMLLICRRRQS